MIDNAQHAERLYVDGLASGSAADDWRAAISSARHAVLHALRDSRFLTDISGAVIENGEHLRVFRHMLAPPISQDQFALLCPAYRKSWEKPGNKVRAADAAIVVAAINRLLDPAITRWLVNKRVPTLREVRLLVAAVAPMISQQTVATVRRGRLSELQERQIIELLKNMGWSQVRGGIVDQSSALLARRFMHKTRFATKTRPQEVDIACGLGKSVVLAMECKVTNDRTNSVKRINNVLKKATAWQDHWGSFIRTAALLQGVIAEKDVARLKAANVHVFWSHDLAAFQSWLEQELNP